MPTLHLRHSQPPWAPDSPARPAPAAHQQSLTARAPPAPLPITSPPCSSGGYLDDAILALDYLTRLKLDKRVPLVASSNSWGCGSSCFSQAMLDAINRGYTAGILVRRGF